MRKPHVLSSRQMKGDSEAAVVEVSHCREIGSKHLALAILKLLDEELDVLGDDLCGVLLAVACLLTGPTITSARRSRLYPYLNISRPASSRYHRRFDLLGFPQPAIAGVSGYWVTGSFCGLPYVGNLLQENEQSETGNGG